MPIHVMETTSKLRHLYNLAGQIYTLFHNFKLFETCVRNGRVLTKKAI